MRPCQPPPRPAPQLARDHPLTDVAVSPGGNLACVTSSDGHCCIWDLGVGKVLHELRGHKGK